MVSLPTSIESYLQEAGFSATEILILKRLLEGEALTLRELAAKTGKSTGVLDQATKKLIERQIVTKESINESMKYAISSLDAINKWMEHDMAQRHEVLDRKRKDFEAFISTVEHESGRPDMEYFEGLAGIEKAFTKLLEKRESAWMHFNPALLREEDDPLVEYRVNMFRARRSNKIFMQVLSPDVPLGRRYQSRDVFEYRQTRLVDPDVFPVSFEQYIVGDTVACIDVAEQRASFIRYPEHAEGQRKLFHVLWCQTEVGAKQEECEVQVETQQEADMKTKLLSAMRECFLSRRAMTILAGFAVFALLVTGGLYKYTLELMKNQISSQLLSIVATSAPEINISDIKAISGVASDMNKPEYQKLYTKLNEIRDQNQHLHLQYAYIMRPSELADMYEFVADADSNYFLPDPNNDEAPEVVPPGTQYEISQLAQVKEEQLLLKMPLADKEATTDKWGTYLSASAPIFDELNDGVAIIGVDMDIGEFYKRVNNTFKPYLWFFGVLGFLVVARLFFLISKK